MKRILITGQTGKVAVALANHLEQLQGEYRVQLMSLKSEWRSNDFSCYDSIFHCAGLTYAGTLTDEDYYRVNVELTRDLFMLAQKFRVKQFIFLSSMSVYGFEKITGENAIPIERTTKLSPVTSYGRSKLCAELEIKKLSINTPYLKVAIIRAPAIIFEGEDNFFSSYKKALKLPFFPYWFLENKRSFIDIISLCELVRILVNAESDGYYFPQNLPALSSSEIVLEINKLLGCRTKMFAVPKCLSVRIPLIYRYFRNISYSDSLSGHFNGAYIKSSSREVIRRLFDGYSSNIIK